MRYRYSDERTVRTAVDVAMRSNVRLETRVQSLYYMAIPTCVYKTEHCFWFWCRSTRNILKVFFCNLWR